MNKPMRHLLSLVLLLSCTLSYADTIYKKVMPDGSTVYSDQPSPDAEEIKTPTTQSFKPVPISTTPPTTVKEKADPAYTGIKITQPGNDETIRHSAGLVSVQISTEPKLKTDHGHKIELKLDGLPVEKPAATTQFSLNNVDRGTHTLEASILDNRGNTLLTSAKTSFHIKRESALLRQKQHPKKTP